MSCDLLLTNQKTESEWMWCIIWYSFIFLMWISHQVEVCKDSNWIKYWKYVCQFIQRCQFIFNVWFNFTPTSHSFSRHPCIILIQNFLLSLLAFCYFIFSTCSQFSVSIFCSRCRVKSMMVGELTCGARELYSMHYLW